MITSSDDYDVEEAFELINDIFNLDLDQDGLISKREFLIVTSQSKTLTALLCLAADREKLKQINNKKKVARLSTSTSISEVPTLLDSDKYVCIKELIDCGSHLLDFLIESENRRSFNQTKIVRFAGGIR